MAKQANQHTSSQEQIKACLTDWEEETNRVARLYKPLVDHLMKFGHQLDQVGIPKKDRAVSLDVEDWPKQYEADIKRCGGFEIRWRGGNG